MKLSILSGGLTGVFVAQIMVFPLMGMGGERVVEDDYRYSPPPLRQDLLEYSRRQAEGRVPRLVKRLERGEIALKFAENDGYLGSLLEALKIPESSQMLVFSKSSRLRRYISPQTPRAIYFNDDTYVGWIPSAPTIEIASVDPNLGAVFYTLDQEPSGRARFKRNDRCLECHVTTKTLDIPGLVMRSFATDEQGNIDLLSGWATINHETPFSLRWGGWYVTGHSGNQRHLGNVMLHEALEREEVSAPDRGNLTDLSPWIDERYYRSPSSDIVALMVYEHQLHMQNLIIRLSYEAKRHHTLRDFVTEFLKYLLFVNEAPLSGEIKGDPRFVAEFEHRGPIDNQGRSLRQFNLKTRIFEYPCSYMIYSEAFHALPRNAKRYVYHRLWRILTGEDAASEFKNISPETKKAVLAILAQTQSDLPVYWTL